MLYLFLLHLHIWLSDAVLHVICSAHLISAGATIAYVGWEVSGKTAVCCNVGHTRMPSRCSYVAMQHALLGDRMWSSSLGKGSGMLSWYLGAAGWGERWA